MVISSQNIAFGDIVSLDSNFVAGQTQDITAKLNADRIALTNGVNNIQGVYAGSAQSSGQIKADTVGEENMADDANPRIRTNESGSCPDYVFSGMLPVTSSSLVGSIPSGVAYPDGYRIEKTDSTAKTFTANKWTYVYLLTSGSFDYQEQTIGGTEPTQPANSARIARVSTDATTIVAVTDLRKTSCAAGPFSAVADTTGEATLGDLLMFGSPVKNTATTGFIQGLHVSYDTNTTFKVTSGGAYINGKYRITSVDLTVTQSGDNPLTGGSGVDTSIAASTRYNVFAVADQSNAKTLSVTYSSLAAPAGVTNYRKIGEIGTSAQVDSVIPFLSSDIVTFGSVAQRELVSGWAHFDGSGAVIASFDSMNVSSVTDLGTGSYAIVWDINFANKRYAVTCGGDATGTDEPLICSPIGLGEGWAWIKYIGHGGVAADCNPCTVIATGERDV